MFRRSEVKMDDCVEWKQAKKPAIVFPRCTKEMAILFFAGILIGMFFTGFVLVVLVPDADSDAAESQVRPQLLKSTAEFKFSGPPVKPDGYWVETLSSDPEPRISLVHNLVTKEEAKHLMFLGAKKGMQKALIIPYGQKHLTQSTVRTNSAAWLDFGQDEVVRKVEKAYEQIVGIPAENGENLQILHYKDGEHFQEHRDYFDPAEDPPENFEPGGNRIATFVLYLQNAKEGGETYFPKLGKKFKPEVGDALLFWDIKPNGELDARTLHSATPVVGGEKWVATKWLHERRYQGLEKHLEIK